MNWKLDSPRAEPRSTKPRGERVPGFTLIELLVVIAVVAILATLLLPTLSRAKAAAETTFCKNNLHEQGIALNMYVSDYKAYPVYYIHRLNARTTFWGDFLEPYTKAQFPPEFFVDTDRANGLYDCPSFRRLKHMGGSSYGYNFVGVARPFDKGSALGLGGVRLTNPDTETDLGSDAYRPNRETEVLHPSDMIAIGDGPLRNYLGSYQTDSVLDDPVQDGGKFPGSSANAVRHSGRFNIAFCDGHVEFIRYAALYAPVTNLDLMMRWNNDHDPHRELLPATP